MADRPRFTEVTPGDPVVPRGNRRFRQGFLWAATFASWFVSLRVLSRR